MSPGPRLIGFVGFVGFVGLAVIAVIGLVVPMAALVLYLVAVVGGCRSTSIGLAAPSTGAADLISVTGGPEAAVRPSRGPVGDWQDLLAEVWGPR